MAEQDEERRIEERVGAAIGRTAGLVVRLPLDILGHGVELLGLVGHGLKSKPGDLPGLDLTAPVAEPTSAEEKPLISVIDYSAERVQRRNVEDAKTIVSSPTAPGPSVRWVNIEGLHPSTITNLARAYDLHPLAAEDVLNVPQRPKFEVFGDTGFLLCRMLRIEGGQLVDEQVSMFVRDGLVIAVREEQPPWLDEQTRTYLRDVHDHVLRVIDLVETFREMANGLSDLYMTQQSHKMNEVMKLLTVMATLFIPLTFLAGVWGMNFKHMPELDWEHGYSIALAVFGGIFVTLLLLFRRRGWL